MAAQRLNAAAERFAGQSIGSIFLYTNEAHPAEHYPPLRSMEQKLKHAQALRDVLGVTRPILADALDGAAHRAYGGNPNMSWIFNRTGTVMYKSDWTEPDMVVRMIDYLLEVQDRRKEHIRQAPYRVERIEYRESDRAAFFEGLARNGQQAVDDFVNAFPETAEFARKYTIEEGASD